MTNTPTFVGFKDAARLSGLSVYFWRKAVADGIAPHIKSGHKIYIDYQSAIEKIRSDALNV